MEPVEARGTPPVAEQAHGNGNKTKGRRAEMGGGWHIFTDVLLLFTKVVISLASSSRGVVSFKAL